MNTAYFVTLDNGSEHLVWTGHRAVVDRQDAAHVQAFDMIRDAIVSCRCIVTDVDGCVLSVHHYAGMDAQIVASMESRRTA